MKNINSSCDTQAPHPKLSDALSFERCAKTIRKLIEQGESMRERLVIVYGFLGDNPNRNPHIFDVVLPIIGSEINPGYLESRASHLRGEYEKEFAEAAAKKNSPLASSGEPKDSCLEFIEKVQHLAYKADIAGREVRTCAMQNRPDRIKHFFECVKNLDDALKTTVGIN